MLNKIKWSLLFDVYVNWLQKHFNCLPEFFAAQLVVAISVADCEELVEMSFINRIIFVHFMKDLNQGLFELFDIQGSTSISIVVIEKFIGHAYHICFAHHLIAINETNNRSSNWL